MTERVTALLVHHRSETLMALKSVLERLGLHVTEAESLAQAKRFLGALNPAPLIFTDTRLSDGAWVDIVALGAEAAKAVNVIVVSRVVDTRFYLEVIETGAFDFIAPPFNGTDLAYVVRTAVDNVVARRTVRRPAAPVPEASLLAGAGKVGTPATRV